MTWEKVKRRWNDGITGIFTFSVSISSASKEYGLIQYWLRLNPCGSTVWLPYQKEHVHSQKWEIMSAYLNDGHVRNPNNSHFNSIVNCGKDERVPWYRMKLVFFNFPLVVSERVFILKIDVLSTWINFETHRFLAGTADVNDFSVRKRNRTVS